MLFVPSSTCSANEIEVIGWKRHRGKLFSPLQAVHDFLNDNQDRYAPNTTSVYQIMTTLATEFHIGNKTYPSKEVAEDAAERSPRNLPPSLREPCTRLKDNYTKLN